MDGAHRVLLLGNYRPTIVVSRELARLGYAVIAGLGGGEGGAEFSRATREVWTHPDVDTAPEQFLSELRNFLDRRSDIQLVFPIAENFVRLLAKAGHAVPADRILVSPPSAVVAVTLDKMRMFARAAAIGVPVAPPAVVDCLDGLRDRARDIGFPLVVRPLASTLRLDGRKVIIVESPAELASAVPTWPAGHDGLIVQKRIIGARHNLYFAAQSGRLLRLVEAVILRTDRRDGTGLAVEGRTVPLSPDLKCYVAALAADLDYSGIGCVQFLVDRARDSVAFLEINARIAGNHAVPEAAGLELSRIAIDIATGNAANAAYREGRTGLSYAWTYGDVRGLKAALAAGELTAGEALRWTLDLALTAVFSQVHMTWSWRDPLPALALLARQAGRPLTGPRPVASAPQLGPVIRETLRS